MTLAMRRITDCAIKKSKIVSKVVPTAFINPISRRLVTISRETVDETTIAPRAKTRRMMNHTKVEKNMPMEVASVPAMEKAETSRSTFPKRKMKVVEAIMLVRDIRTNVDLNGRRFRSFEAKLSNSVT